MTNTKKYKGGDRKIKPEAEDDLFNPENPNYLLTDVEFQKQKKETEEMKKNPEGNSRR
ncbi:MAG: hypothetical protein Q7J14_00925 [Candidatus Magasanikbacteria bacterium]|nr:hypothetical protein [Candidatus Magasanikbacteria bacterium]